MNIAGFQKTTLLDYPGHVAATVFTQGCNFRCPFCHNGGLIAAFWPSGPDRSPCASSLTASGIAQPSDIALPSVVTCPSVAAKELIETSMTREVLAFLQKRKAVLSGVCITGGEPTLQPDLIPFLRQIKSLGYRIKLDTNGYLPDVLSSLLKERLLDYIAMDVKAGPSGYAAVAGIGEADFSRILASIRLIESSGLAYEFRTTLVQEFHGEKELLEIADLLSPQSPYYLQSFRDSGHVLRPGLHAHSRETLLRLLNVVRARLPGAALRGID